MADKINITVTMPVTEYERLIAKEKGLAEIIGVLERANPDCKSAIMTEELELRIKEIYY